MKTLSGIAISRGFVSGPVIIVSDEVGSVQLERSVAPEKVLEEIARFHSARRATRRQLEDLIEDLRLRVDASSLDIFKNHLVMVDDPTLIREVESYISIEFLSAETSLKRVCAKFRDAFEKMDDPYLRERIRDIEDVERRLMKQLVGDETPPVVFEKPSIIIADELTPSDTVSIPREMILGFAMNKGSSTSHVSLLARSLDIPAVVGLGDIVSQVKPGDIVLLDGTHGCVTVNPDEETIEGFERLSRRERELKEILADDESRTGSMKDGTIIHISANVQPGVPLECLKTFGAHGIGLYRSEFLWLSREDEPSEELQFEYYSAAAKAVAAMGNGARVTFRVLDLGGDKLQRGAVMNEANPFLGNRSIRYLLSHRDVFKRQLRAILRASAFGPSAIMYPMVSTLQELREANFELRAIKSELRTEGISFDENIPVGVMIEVPAAAICARQFAREADFLSIGTNDLIQYTMAVDRGNASVAGLYQPTHPAVISLMQQTISAANEEGISVCVCGETASDPILGVLWVGMGVNELSMSASFIPILKKTLRELSLSDARELAAAVNNMGGEKTAAAIYSYCRDYILKKVPQLEEIQSFFTSV